MQNNKQKHLVWMIGIRHSMTWHGFLQKTFPVDVERSSDWISSLKKIMFIPFSRVSIDIILFSFWTKIPNQHFFSNRDHIPQWKDWCKITSIPDSGYSVCFVSVTFYLRIFQFVFFKTFFHTSKWNSQRLDLKKKNMFRRFFFLKIDGEMIGWSIQDIIYDTCVFNAGHDEKNGNLQIFTWIRLWIWEQMHFWNELAIIDLKWKQIYSMKIFIHGEFGSLLNNRVKCRYDRIYSNWMKTINWTTSRT